MSKFSRVNSKSQKSTSKEQPQSNNQGIEERVMIMMNKKLAKRKRLRKEEFVEQYVPNSILFGYGEPTKADINSAYILVKNSRKRKRVKRKSEPEMSKEEFVATRVRNSQLWGETPTEEDINREWDLYKLNRQYNALRSDKKKAAFRECMEQVITDRYSPAKIEERRLQKENEMNKRMGSMPCKTASQTQQQEEPIS